MMTSRRPSALSALPGALIGLALAVIILAFSAGGPGFGLTCIGSFAIGVLLVYVAARTRR